MTDWSAGRETSGPDVDRWTRRTAFTVRAVLAVVRREWQVQRRYPLSMINLVLLTPLYRLALPTLLLGSAFAVDGRAAGLASRTGTADLAGWTGLGVLAASFQVGAAISVYGTLEADRLTGVIEHSWSTRASREAYVVGGVLTGTLFAAAANTILLVLAALLLHASFSPAGALVCLPVLAVSTIGNCGFGYLVASLVLRMRRAEAVVDLIVVLSVLFSGVSFPVSLLPGAARWPAFLLPGTWGLDLTRHAALSARPLAPIGIEVAAAAAVAAGWLLLGRLTFVRTERHLRRAGTLAQF